MLVLSPTGGDDGDTCIDLLSPSDPASTNLLFVSFTGRPQDRLGRWIARAGGRPASSHLVASRDVAERLDPDGPRPDDVDHVGSPNDLTGLSIRVSEVLNEWDGSEARSAVCFDSVTALLQYVDVRTAYEFLHVLTGRLYAFGATGHFHLDPDAHDATTVAQMQTLFDAVVTVNGGGVTVRRQ